MAEQQAHQVDGMLKKVGVRFYFSQIYPADQTSGLDVVRHGHELAQFRIRLRYGGEPAYEPTDCERGQRE